MQAFLELAPSHLVKVRANRRGSGWAIGRHGVLTARHVVQEFIEGKAEQCWAVLDPSPEGPGFSCSVVYEDVQRDLAVLEIDAVHAEAWQRAIGAGATVLARPGTHNVAVDAIGFPDVTLGERGTSEPESISGKLKPAGGALTGRMPLDVDGGVPQTSLAWRGMSGAAVFDAHHRLLGVIVEVDKDWQQRRMYVAVLPDPQNDDNFARAVRQVGGPTVIEAAEAPTARQLISLLDEAGRPYRVDRVPDLGRMGVRLSRTDVDTHGDPFYPYLSRDSDHELNDAVDARARGADQRILLLVGVAMAGKSRCLAEALRQSELLNWLLVPPLPEADLDKIVDLYPGNIVIWLDDLERFLPRLNADRLARMLARQGVAVVATVRTERLQSLTSQPEFRSGWDLINDSRLVQRINLPTAWTEEEKIPLREREPILLDAVSAGKPLGEALGAADEMLRTLQNLSDWPRALADLAADWPRTGMSKPLPEEAAIHLWTAYLTPAAAEHFNDLPEDDRKRRYEETLSQLTRAVAPEAMTTLVQRRRGGLTVDGYVTQHRGQTNAVPPDPVWEAAVETALDDQALAVGVAASGFSRWTDAAHAFTRARDSSIDVYATAGGVNLTIVLLQLERLDEAIDALQQVIDRYSDNADPAHRELMAFALTYLGGRLVDLGRPAEAMTAFQQVVERYSDDFSAELRQQVAKSLAGLGGVLADLNPAEAIRTFQQIIDRYGRAPAPALREQVATAMNGQAGALIDLGRPDEAISAFQQVIDRYGEDPTPEMRKQIAVALHNIGQLDQPAEAVVAYQQIVDRYGDDPAPELRNLVAVALHNLGGKLTELDRTAEALVVHQQIIDRYGDDSSPLFQELLAAAQRNLRDARTQLDRDAEAAIAYQRLVDHGGAPDPALGNRLANALVEQARSLVERRRYAEANAKYQEVIDRYGEDADSELRQQVARALTGKAGGLVELDQAAEAVPVYQQVVDRYGEDPDQNLRRLVGLTLANLAGAFAKLDRPTDEISAYQQVIDRYGEDPDSELRKLVPAVLHNLRLTIAKLDRSADKISAYEQIIDRYGENLDPAMRKQVAAVLIDQAGALIRLSRFADALATYQEVIDRYGDDPASELREQVAVALYGQGTALAGLDRLTDALVVFHEIVDRYSEDPEPEVRRVVAVALTFPGSELVERGRLAEAQTALQQVIDRYGEDPDPALRQLVAKALHNLGRASAKRERFTDAAATYQKVIDHYGKNPDPALRRQVAAATNDQAYALLNLGGRLDEALATYQKVIDCYGKDPDPALRDQVATAMTYLGIAFSRMDRSADALLVYQKVVDRYGPDPDPALRKLVAMSLADMGATLAKLGRSNEAETTYQAVIERFGTDPAMRNQVEQATTFLNAIEPTPKTPD